MNNTNVLKRRLYNAALLGLLTTACFAASAKDYKVEVVLFDNNNAAQASERLDYVAPKPMRSAADTWLISPTMLNDESQRIDDAPDYEVRHHLAWGQEALPYSKSAVYTLLEPNARGYIKVYADQLLFANIDIDYKGFRMQEKRRLKLNERHFFDHPKFGVLMQVSRLEPTPEDLKDLEDTESAENDTLDNEVELESSR